ncbi:MAG TPA: hypothetical protein VJ861_07685, partial [Treponemataceae bacterium]|nr:hypothetical protein [Treponemataceae bacterium]
ESAMIWDILIDNKNGSFGFNSLDGFIRCGSLDVSSLVVGGEDLAMKVLLGGGDNCSLTETPKSGSVYTVAIIIDQAKSVADGRYTMLVDLKTLGTEDWAFEVPASVFITGDVTGGWNENDDAILRPSLTVAAAAATYEFTAGADGSQGFKISLKGDSGWDGLVGFGSVVTTGTTIPLVDDGGNISFTAVKDTVYVLTIAFPASYVADGKPVVTVTLAP